MSCRKGAVMTVRDKSYILLRILATAEYEYNRLDSDGMLIPVENSRNHEILDNAIEKIRKEIDRYGRVEQAE